MNIKILGSGCAKCNKLEENVREALYQAEIDASITKVKDLNDIMSYGIMMTPGLVINEKVISAGKLLTVEQILQIIS